MYESYHIRLILDRFYHIDHKTPLKGIGTLFDMIKVMSEKEDSSYNNSTRRWFHFVTVVTIGLIYGLSNLTWMVVLPYLCIATSIVLGVDMLRIHIPPLNRLFQHCFGFILRKHEFHTLSGSSWLMLGAIINISLFPKTIAALGFLYLAIGDPLASYIGIKYGKTSIGTKSWVGTLAFFISTWAVGWLWLLQLAVWQVAFWAAGGAALAAAIAERELVEIDDNLVIPPIASGFSLLLCSFL